MNVSFVIRHGKSFVGQLKHGFDYTDFISLVQCRLGMIDFYRFIVCGKELAVHNRAVFDQQKYLFQNGMNIFVLKRLVGGYVEMSVLRGIIINDLEQELQKIPTTNAGERLCEVCCDNPNFVRLCCNRICKCCFSNYFELASFQLKCMTCRRSIPYSQFFISNDFIHSLESFEEVRELLRNIDCQICQCGTLAVNETLFAQQTCELCKRTFCFFCNKDWNEGNEKRRNDRYTCHVNCDYETRLSFELVPLEVNKSVMVPNRRFCPFCFTPGAYGNKCKYHTCDVCSRSFCFICLNEQEECQTKYGSNYQHECTKVKIQRYSDFPTIAKH
jgi:hypothetical protein